MLHLTAGLPYPLVRLIEQGEISADDFEARAIRTSRALDRMELQALRDVKKSLRSVDREIRDNILKFSDANELGRSDINKIIDQSVDRFRDNRRTTMQRATQRSVDLAQDFRQGIANIAKQPIPQGTVPATLAGDLIEVQNVANDAFADNLRSRLKREVADGVVRGKTPNQIAKDMVAKRITTPIKVRLNQLQKANRRAKGLPELEARGALGQAERLSRTEIRQAFNGANFAGGRAEQRDTPGILKIWVKNPPRVRDTHIDAARRYRIGGNPGPIPFHHKFRVGEALLRFPGDPAGPIEEIANCKCLLVEIRPEVGEKLEK